MLPCACTFLLICAVPTVHCEVRRYGMYTRARTFWIEKAVCTLYGIVCHV